MTSIERVFFESPNQNYTSIVVLMVAMAFSRFGLWLTDLTINQIIQESVREEERGTIGGVQTSLNRCFALIKYALVVFLSDVRQYGYLVIASAFAVLVAFFLYIVYVCLHAYKANESYEQFWNETTSAYEIIEETPDFTIIT